MSGTSYAFPGFPSLFARSRRLCCSSTKGSFPALYRRLLIRRVLLVTQVGDQKWLGALCNLLSDMKNRDLFKLFSDKSRRVRTYKQLMCRNALAEFPKILLQTKKMSQKKSQQPRNSLDTCRIPLGFNRLLDSAKWQSSCIRKSGESYTHHQLGD